MQKLDTIANTQAGGNRSWSIAVPNGQYQVYVVAGDSAGANDRMAITVEGEVAVSGITRTSRRYLDGLVTVNVTDGAITVDNAPWAVNNKICYLGIVGTQTSDDKTISVSAPVPVAKEDGPVTGYFRITRDGPDDSAVTVPVAVSGSATNGVDYGTFGTAVTFAAGQTTIDPARPARAGRRRRGRRNRHAHDRRSQRLRAGDRQFRHGHDPGRRRHHPGPRHARLVPQGQQPSGQERGVRHERRRQALRLRRVRRFDVRPEHRRVRLHRIDQQRGRPSPPCRPAPRRRA